ncbi:Poly(A) polymerase central domain-containing protein [Fennellomyces sp. T-0311]|nr:Poly(A) polymerase central domain-containing protein [Fennellomyces sp. T-0311]
MRSNISNDVVRRYLARSHVIEDDVQARKRKDLYANLRSLLPDFVRRVAKRKSLRRDDMTCQLMPFGSYAIGGYISGADMDLVLLSPWSIDRRDFFGTFRQLLQRLTEKDDIELIKRTAVPIIKCIIDSISVDISFVRLRLVSVPADINILDDSLLDGLDKECLASMDGPRTQKYIMDHIEKRDLAVFQCSLQCIKHWATRRYLYGKPIGYLNGSTWTFLLLKTYMSMSNQQVGVYSLLQTFFDMWADWSWPEPMLLAGHIPDQYGGSLTFNDLDDFRMSAVPIVSPCYPVCNATPFATTSTRRVLTQEFKRARTIMMSDDFLDINSLLTKLFKEMNFFAQYTHFLRVVVISERPRSDDTWKRKMATAIPKLVELLEGHPEIFFIHPYTKSYSTVAKYSTQQGRSAILEGCIDIVEKFLSELNPGKLYVTTHLIGLEINAAGTEVDVSNEVGAFLDELESKRNDKDSDVTFKILSAKRSDLRKFASE